MYIWGIHVGILISKVTQLNLVSRKITITSICFPAITVVIVPPQCWENFKTRCAPPATDNFRVTIINYQYDKTNRSEEMWILNTHIKCLFRFSIWYEKVQIFYLFANSTNSNSIKRKHTNSSMEILTQLLWDSACIYK